MTRFKKEEQLLYNIYCAVLKALGYSVRKYYPYFSTLKEMSE